VHFVTDTKRTVVNLILGLFLWKPE
jgi:hypothetical protein